MKNREKPEIQKEGKSDHGILGIAQGASDEEIQRAFHALAKKHHPDVGGDEQCFKEISAAYERLKNQKVAEKHEDEMTDDEYDEWSQTLSAEEEKKFDDMYETFSRDIEKIVNNTETSLRERRDAIENLKKKFLGDLRMNFSYSPPSHLDLVEQKADGAKREITLQKN